MNKRASLSITVADLYGRLRTFQGRDAWALRELIQAGEKGCTQICTPGPRWSAYVFKLRREGIDIETRHETHGGPFPGNHARYILRTPLHIVERKAA